MQKKTKSPCAEMVRKGLIMSKFKGPLQAKWMMITAGLPNLGNQHSYG